MIRYLQKIWEDLGRNILVGERYEKNMRGIKLVALLIVAVNIITGCLNLKNGYYSAAVAAFLFILAGLIILFFTHLRQNRKGAVITAQIAVVIIFTYEAITVKHGFTIFWTLILPWAFCYFGSVKAGISLSLYFMVLYCILFFTPLRDTLAAHYSEIIAQRFPLLYLADVILTTYIMVQYHRITLHQMDNAKQLREAKEEADRANAAKSDFLANMSHEIRTPINAMMGMNEMILRESARAGSTDPEEFMDDQQKAFDQISIYAEDVKRAGNNLLAIINNILDFSKIEANRMEIVEGGYKFSSVLNDVSNLVIYKAKEKNLGFVVNADETLPDGLYGDEVRVRQVITNLLTNAVKYTNEGSICLSVSHEKITEEAGNAINLIISVRDTGIGIRKEDIEKLFTKFERIDLENNSTVEGTGLGLAITQALVSMMGGRIWVESVYGEGSTFTVSLPQKVISSEPLGNFSGKFEKSIQDTEAYKESFYAPEARILIVDDTPMNLSVAAGLLRGTGIRIDTACSGEEAIALAVDNPYDLIFMDQRMPKMDGTETMNHIRTQAADVNGKTPIVCLTADAILGAKERYIAEGFSDYLSKPAEGSSLEKMLMKYLPEEKIRPIRQIPKTAAENMATDFEQLTAAGIQPKTGLNYCQDDEKLYRSLLREYARNAAEKVPEIQCLYSARKWKDYAILVHALKSTSRMIGAETLSETAAYLEKAAGQGQEEMVRSRHPDMMSQYDAVVSEILIFLGEEGDMAGEEDDILEFLPEEESDHVI